jgi:hypothetical protein
MGSRPRSAKVCLVFFAFALILRGFTGFTLDNSL